jgi:hypothetical protein
MTAVIVVLLSAVCIYRAWAFVVFRHRLAVPNPAPSSARPDERKTDIHERR